MMEEKHRGMVARYIFKHMLQRQLVKKLAQHRYLYIYLTGDILFIYRNRIREYACISTHQDFKYLNHLPVRKLDIIQLVTAYRYLHLRGYVHIFRHRPMSGPFDIDYRIINSLSLQLEAPAELIQIELELAACSRLVRYVIEDMYLMIDILYILK